MRWARICASCVAVMVFQGVRAEALNNPEESRNLERHEEKHKTFPQIFQQERLSNLVVESPVIVVLPKITEAPNLVKRKLGSIKWDMIHDQIQGQKRDVASCQSGYQMCPQSLNGGCCPSDRVCGSSSCYAASAAPASACGMTGYIACGISDGGGCCPESYICGSAGCTVPVGVSFSETCGVNSYLCPASLNYGCCKNGMGCGLNNCYSTEIVTYTLTDTITTSEDGHLQTLTTTIVTSAVPSAPTPLATTSLSGVIPKVGGPTTAPAIAKTKSSGDSSGGLSKDEIGGIIGGAIVLLLVLLAASFFIIRRLKQVDKAIEEAIGSTSGGRSRLSQPTKQTSSTLDVDTMSIDPLIMAPSEMSESVYHSRHGSVPSQFSAVHSSHHEVEASSPPVFQTPYYSPGSPPFNNYNRGYTPVAVSDTSSSGLQTGSLESTPGFTQSPAGYFDIPANRNSDFRDQNMRFGHSPSTSFWPRRPSTHGRQWSQSSDVSAASSNMIELDASPDGDQRSSIQRALQGLGMRLSMSRRKSSAPVPNVRRTSEPVILTGGPGRPEWAGTPAVLGHIAEAGESRLDLQELGNGTLSPGMREQLLQEAARIEAYKRLQETPHTEATGQETELLKDVDLKS